MNVYLDLNISAWADSELKEPGYFPRGDIILINLNNCTSSLDKSMLTQPV